MRSSAESTTYAQEVERAREPHDRRVQAPARSAGATSSGAGRSSGCRSRVLGYLAAACGGDEAAAPPAPPAPPAEPAPAEPPAEPLPPSSASRRAAGGRRNDPGGADPARDRAEPAARPGRGRRGHPRFDRRVPLLLGLRTSSCSRGSPRAGSRTRTASVWTFKIRQGVTFHDGTPLTAKDVVATFEKLIDPDGGSSNAQSALGGVLSPGGIEAPDDATVVFNLDAPNGNFPTLVSSANYNAIIIPADLDPADWGQTFMGTGPVQARELHAAGRADGRPQRRLLGPKALADKLDIKFYAEEAAMVLGLQGDEVDFVEHFSVGGGKALLEDPNVQVIAIRTATHRQLSCATTRSRSPTSASARRSRSRSTGTALVDGLWEGRPTSGNDSPFAPLYPSTDKSVPQREQDIELAKQLMADAGVGRLRRRARNLDTGSRSRTSPARQELRREIGVNINLNITDSAHVLRRRRLRQLALARRGHGPRRLRSPAGAERLLRRAFAERRGVWNAAHFKNPTFDQLVSGVRRGARPRHRSGRSRSRSRSSCSTRRRSSSPTSTTSSRRRSRTCRERSRRRPASSTSRRRRSRPRPKTRGGRPGRGPGRPPRRCGAAMARFLLKRLGLAVITLFLLSVIVFFGLAGPARKRRPAHPRTVRRRGGRG